MPYFILFIALLSGCCPSIVKIDDVDTGTKSNQDSVLEFDNCSQHVGDHPCNFSLINQHGVTVNLYDFYEKIIVVDLSVMWCAPCQQMAQAADRIVLEYGNENVEWLTLLIEDNSGNPPDQEDTMLWATQNNITGHVLASDRSIIDNTPELTTGYPITGWPTFVVIDDEMVLRYGVTGWSEEMLKQMLDILVLEKQNRDG
ncbi:MAG: TlpA family protein disulfide reductase [Rhodobacteraceae bacterium]|nr:TlpA family protein disulfide reductase [Paracoccaceae bacterium]